MTATILAATTIQLSANRSGQALVASLRSRAQNWLAPDRGSPVPPSTAPKDVASVEPANTDIDPLRQRGGGPAESNAKVESSTSGTDPQRAGELPRSPPEATRTPASRTRSSPLATTSSPAPLPIEPEHAECSRSTEQCREHARLLVKMHTDLERAARLYYFACTYTDRDGCLEGARLHRELGLDTPKARYLAEMACRFDPRSCEPGTRDRPDIAGRP